MVQHDYKHGIQHFAVYDYFCYHCHSVHYICCNILLAALRLPVDTLVMLALLMLLHCYNKNSQQQRYSRASYDSIKYYWQLV